MAQLNTSAGPVAWAIVLICVLAVGFMIRFLAAILAEERTSRAHASLHVKTLEVSDGKILEAPLDDELSFTPMARFSQRMARIGSSMDSVRPLVSIEINSRW